MGVAAITKKRGGYTNTKLHGMVASLGYFVALGGLYAIYHNKNLYQRPHFASLHGKAGIAILMLTVLPMAAGGIVLHPDWGLDKTNQEVRKIHKLASRILMGASWGTAIYGMYSMTKDPFELAIYAGPLVLLAPFTLV